MTTFHLNTAGATCRITIAEHALQTVYPRLATLRLPRSARFFFVTSPEIWQLWSTTALSSFPADAKPPVLFLPSGERHKRLATVEQLAETLARHHADRNAVLLALGGGVVGDVAGFLAAVYMRGIACVQLPTTLLAQVDSSVGGKTGVNLAAGKNLVGSFHQPVAVITDPATLRTLPPRELRAGMQEAIKSGLLGNRRLFQFIEGNTATLLDPHHPANLASLTRVVAASVRVKAAIVAEDERESGRRMLLNLGHTLGHAIEAATRYRGLLHGEAVAWGMIAALHLAQARGTLSAVDATRAQSLIQAFGPLPRFRATAEQLVALSAGDKKRRGGVLSFVLPVALGRAEVVRDVSEAELLAAADAMLRLMRARSASPLSSPAAPSASPPAAQPRRRARA